MSHRSAIAISSETGQANLACVRAASSPSCAGFLLACLTLAANIAIGHDTESHGGFLYDAADREPPAHLSEIRSYYDADLAWTDGELRACWLEFQTGKGDVIWLGRPSPEGWIKERKVVPEPGRYARPTLTQTSDNELCLTYEAYDAETKQWDIKAYPDLNKALQSETTPIRIGGAGNDINHAVAPSPNGELWLAWQADRDGKFRILAQRLSRDGAEGKPGRVSKGHGGWHPAITVLSTGRVRIVWDAYDGESFNVLGRDRDSDGQWSSLHAIATGPAFQGRAQIVRDSRDRTWVLWEQGAHQWGDPFRGNVSDWDNITDAYGPLHRHRRIRLARLTSDGTVRRLAHDLPMPATQAARNRQEARDGARLLGSYYERGRLTVDQSDRLWVLYRHFYNRQSALDEPVDHHKERGWRIYARRLEGESWSPLYAFAHHQRDGLQRLNPTVTDNGIAAVWTVGRTDRRQNTARRGLAHGRITLKEGAVTSAPTQAPQQTKLPSIAPDHAPPSKINLDNTSYKLFKGDLHRHTDLSLCFPFFDGSIDDAYRYAIEVSRLDFLGITDHARDIARGDARSHLWWRSTKEVTRHRLRDRFLPFFAYERSRAGADHNVISLKPDMLWPHTSPHPDFWKRIDDRHTLTIPHNTTSASNPARRINPATWDIRPDQSWKRPLVEVYQGLRDQVSVPSAERGLQKDHRMGFIASSDHMSTSAAYAGVWAKSPSRKSIFRAMLDRRTLAATTEGISVVFRAGNHWMGERVKADSPITFRIQIHANAPLKEVRIFKNGDVTASLPLESDASSLQTQWQPQSEVGPEESYFYVHAELTDGNQAWSSPIWIRTP